MKQTFIREKFGSLPLLNHRFVILEGAQGTGKSTTIRNALASNPHDILFITHRQSLSHKGSEDFGIEHYETAELGSHTGSLSIVINSLFKTNATQFKGSVVVLDEYTQVLRHLMGSTLDRTRPLVLSTFKEILANGKCVIAADADYASEAVAYLGKLMGRAMRAHYKNQFYPKGRSLVMVPNPTELINSIFSDVRTGKKVVVACDTKVRTHEIKRILTAEFPQYKIRCINSDNGATKETKDFYRYINAEMEEHHVLIYSPSMFTGVDVSVPDVIEEVYLFAESGDLPASDLVQAVHRVRKPITERVHAYVTAVKGNNPTDEALLREEFLETRCFPGLMHSANGKSVVRREFKPFIAYAVKAEARKNTSCNALCESFIALMKAQGYQVQGEREALDSGFEPSASKQALISQMLPLVPLPSDGLLKKIENKDEARLPLYWQAQHSKHKYYKVNGDEEEGLEDLYKFDVDALTRAKDNLAYLFEPKPATRQSTTETLLEELEASYGGYQKLLDGTITKRQLKGFQDVCRENRHPIQEDMFVIRGDLDKSPGSTFRNYLEWAFNFITESQQKSVRGKREFHLRLNQERYQLMMDVLRRNKPYLFASQGEASSTVAEGAPPDMPDSEDAVPPQVVESNRGLPLS